MGGQHEYKTDESDHSSIRGCGHGRWAPSPAQAASERALWVWEGPTESVIDFPVANSFTDLYLHTTPGFSQDPEYLPFVNTARIAGLQVLAMGGDPSWAWGRSGWGNWVDQSVTFGAFDGIVFDVEPHTLPDWNTKRRNRLIRSYLSTLDDASTRAGSLPTFITVPFWWDDPAFKTKKRLLIEHVLNRSDGIIIMAYRDHALGVDRIIEHSATEATMAAASGKQFIVGIETGFAEERMAAMESELSLVGSTSTGNAAYGGITIHHYGSYSAMAPSAVDHRRLRNETTSSRSAVIGMGGSEPSTTLP